MDNSNSEKDTEMKKKSYEDIWRDFSSKHGDNAYTKQIHVKWKKIAAEVNTP